MAQSPPASRRYTWLVIGGTIILAGCFAVWFVFFRDIPTTPDKVREPDLVQPARAPFEEFQVSWNSGNAAEWMVTEHLARLSLSAYDDLQTFRITSNSLGIGEVSQLEKRSMIAYVAWQGDVMVIAFRGTDDIEDWIVNCDCFAPEPTEDGGIHAGFNHAYATMRKDIHDIVRKRNPQYLWVTGHSLGGALATVCAYDLYSYDTKYPFGLMTFGQPMVATLDLANSLHKKLDGRFVHFANREDPVPRVPSFSYRHFGSLAMFGDSGIRRRWDVYQTKPADGTAAKETAERNDMPPLSPVQLRELQERIQQEKRRRMSQPDSTYQWTVPSLSAHGMQLYLDNVRRWVTNGGKGVSGPGDAAQIPPGTGPVPRGK